MPQLLVVMRLALIVGIFIGGRFVMSTLKVNTIKDNGTAIDLENGVLIGGASPTQNYTASGTEPSSGNANGDYWWDTGNDQLYQYWDSEFRAITTVPPVILLWW